MLVNKKICFRKDFNKLWYSIYQISSHIHRYLVSVHILHRSTYSYFLYIPSCQENQTSYDGVAFYCHTMAHHRSSTQQQFQMCVPWDHSISIKCYVLVNCRSSAVLDLVLPSHNISWKTVIAGEIKLRLLAKLKAIRLINTEVKMTEFL